MGNDSRARFEAIYDRCYERILGYVVRRCDSPEDAADVVAETFTVAWRRIHDLPDGDDAQLWLYGCARRVLLHHYRSERRRHDRQARLQGELARFYQTARNAESDLTEIGDAFRRLSDDDRELLTLVAWEGLDNAEIATVLNSTRNAVKLRLHRARKRFAKRLSEAGIDYAPYVLATSAPGRTTIS